MSSALWVERCHQKATVAQQHGLAVQLGQHLNSRADLGDARRADEDAADRALTIGSSRSASKLATCRP